MLVEHSHSFVAKARTASPEERNMTSSNIRTRQWSSTSRHWIVTSWALHQRSYDQIVEDHTNNLMQIMLVDGEIRSDPLQSNTLC